MSLLKSKAEIEKMRASGRVVARTLRLMGESIVPGKTTPKELDAMAAKIVQEAGGVPSFLNYRVFPANTCISVNDTVVHGIPDDVPLESGWIISLDMGVLLDGWHALLGALEALFGRAGVTPLPADRRHMLTILAHRFAAFSSQLGIASRA